MIEHDIQLRVRYAETDQMGYVYYGNYATYLEVARVETFRSIGFSYKEMEEDGVMMPVLEYKTKYLRPAKYDDLLTVKVKVVDQPKVRIRFEYEIFNEKNELLNISETTLVFIDAATNKPAMPTPRFQAILDKYFQK